MAQKFLTNINLNQNQLINATFEKLGIDPVSGFEGQLIYNTTTDTIKVYTGSAWKSIPHTIVSGGGAGIAEALTVSENNGTFTLTLNVADTDSAGLLPAAFWQMLEDATSDATASKLVKRDGNGNFKAATPTDPAHVATKGYVDSARSGLDVKQSVRVATTAAINLADDLQAGDVIDGVTLVAGDRVLVKDQVTASENGIYVAVASGAASRSSDANGTADTGEVSAGTFTFVEEGTTNSDKGFVVSTNGTITVGVTGITWTQFSGAGQIVAGDALEKVGETLNVLVDATSIEIVADQLRIASGAAGDGLSASVGVLSVNTAANGGLEISGDDLQIKIDSSVAGLTTTSNGLALSASVAGDGLTFTAGVLSRNTIDLAQGSDDTTGTLPIDQGGTGQTSASAARDALAQTSSSGANTSTPTLARVASKVVGDGVNTSYTVTHNFGTRAVVVQVYDSSNYDTVIADVERSTTDSVVVSFSVAPASNAYTVVVTG